LKNPYKKRSFRPLILLLTACLLLVVIACAAAWGSVYVPPGAVFRICLEKITGWQLTESLPEAWITIILQIRIPRVLLAALVGMSRAVAGGVYQAVFRNPLADPYLIGVSSGASFGATIAIYFVWQFSFGGLNAISLAAFAGAVLSILVIYSLSHVGGRTLSTILILAGVALGSILTAGTTFFMFTAKSAFQTVQALGWIMGSLAATRWSELGAVLPYILTGFIVIALNAHNLNVLQLDEHQAQSLGLPVERLKIILILATTLVTAAAVSVSGVIGFVGLVIPHIVRMIWGQNHRFLLPMSALLGAVLLILADCLARNLFVPRELPIGVVTALMGAPFFLYLLRRQKKEIM